MALEAAVPAWAAQPLLYLLLLLLLHWLGDYGGRRLSARDAQRRLDAGARVPLREAPLPVLGRGVLVSGAAGAVVLWRVVVLAAAVVVAAGVRAVEMGEYKRVEVVKYAGGGGGGTRVEVRWRMAESVAGVCRRNSVERSVFYELLDPGKVVAPLAETDEAPGVVGRAFCAEPGVVNDVAEVYHVDVDVATVVLPVAGEVLGSGLGGAPKEGVARAAGVETPVRVWGAAESQKDVGALACPRSAGKVCLYLGDANEHNERVLVAVDGGSGEDGDGEAVRVKPGFAYIVVNMQRMRDGFLPRALLYLLAVQETGVLSPTKDKGTAAATLQAIVLMDLVTPVVGDVVSRRTGDRQGVLFEVWALAVLGALVAVALLQALLLALPRAHATAFNEYSFVVGELLQSQEEKPRRGSSFSEKAPDQWFVSEGTGGIKLLALKEAEGDRRSFVSVRTDG